MGRDPCVVRWGRATDARSIARVHVETWRAAYAGMVPDVYLVGMTEAAQAARWQRVLMREGASERVLVAEATKPRGRLLVGFGSCGLARRSTLPYKGEVYTLYVAGDWQGRGIGRRLLGSLFQVLLRGGSPDAVLWVLSANPSRFFYERMGGRKVAEQKESFAGTLLDESAYAWDDLGGWLKSRRTD